MRVTLLPLALTTVGLSPAPVLAKQPQTPVESQPAAAAPAPPPATDGAAGSEPAAAVVDSDEFLLSTTADPPEAVASV